VQIIAIVRDVNLLNEFSVKILLKNIARPKKLNASLPFINMEIRKRHKK